MGCRMLNIEQLMILIGFYGDCPYTTLQDIHDDSDMLFTPEQKLKLECIKNISFELMENPKYGEKENEDE